MKTFALAAAVTAVFIALLVSPELFNEDQRRLVVEENRAHTVMPWGVLGHQRGTLSSGVMAARSSVAEPAHSPLSSTTPAIAMATSSPIFASLMVLLSSCMDTILPRTLPSSLITECPDRILPARMRTPTTAGFDTLKVWSSMNRNFAG